MRCTGRFDGCKRDRDHEGPCAVPIMQADDGIWIDTEPINFRSSDPMTDEEMEDFRTQWKAARHDRPVLLDPLTDPIPEDQTRLGDNALTLHELARAEHRNRLKARIGTVYRSRETMARRIGRWLRGIS